MATSYKYFTPNDKIVAVNQLFEVVTHVSGAENWASSSYAPNYFTQYGSGSALWPLATRTFDITFGRSPDATGSASDDIKAEHNIYNQFGKVLLGHDSNSNILKFNLDPDDPTEEKVLHNAYFINFTRSQMKDKIRQGSFSLVLDSSGSNITLYDNGPSGISARECRTGYYGLLYATSSSPNFTLVSGQNDVQGLLFYEAGVAVVSPYVFSKYNLSNLNPSGSNLYLNENELGILTNTAPYVSGTSNIFNMVASSSIEENNYGLATSIVSANYQSITELNSTIYFCRAYNNEFNYSSNPTYIKDGEIIVKGGDPERVPRTYITTVGLYSEDNQLLAVAKLSEPILKTPENELIARVRLDF